MLRCGCLSGDEVCWNKASSKHDSKLPGSQNNQTLWYEYNVFPVASNIQNIHFQFFCVFSFLFLFFLYMKLGLRFKGWQSGLRGVRRSAQCSVLVSLHVQRQVVGAGEAAVAHPALERLGTRVLPVVAGQLVRPRKPPVAALPGALVGLLTCKEETRGGEGLPQDRVQSPHHALKAPES